MDDAARVAAGFVEAERRRALSTPIGEVVELDGVVLAFTNLADPALNPGIVVAVPSDPSAAIAKAEGAAAERGHPLGLEIERGRFPEVEAALVAAGFAPFLSNPAMTVDAAEIGRAGPPEGAHVTHVVDAAGLAAMVHVETEAFGTDLEVARGLLSMGMVRDPQTRAFVALLDGEPVAQSIATHHDGATGIFGVGVRSSARRRGIGSAMTAIAAAAFRDADLVWLHAVGAARSLYERLGFREVAAWDVWGRPSGEPG